MVIFDMNSILPKTLARLILIVFCFYFGFCIWNISILSVCPISIGAGMAIIYGKEFIDDITKIKNIKFINELNRKNGEIKKKEFYKDLPHACLDYFEFYIKEPVWLPALLPVPINEFFIENIANGNFPACGFLSNIMDYLDLSEEFHQGCSEFSLRGNYTDLFSNPMIARYNIFIKNHINKSGYKKTNDGDNWNHKQKQTNKNSSSDYRWVNTKKSMIFLGWNSDTITIKELKIVYRKKMKEVHPDLNQHRIEWATQMTKKTNIAKKNIISYFNLKE